MGRYIGPVEKLERRGPTPPGQHGARRRRAPSVYGQQLREAQELKIAYGIRERQMRRLVDRARRNREATADVGLIPAWLVADHEALSGKVLRAPKRSEIAMPVTEQLVIERYARR